LGTISKKKTRKKGKCIKLKGCVEGREPVKNTKSKKGTDEKKEKKAEGFFYWGGNNLS